MSDPELSTFGERVVGFWRDARPPVVTTPGIEILDPTTDPAAVAAIETYYRRFFASNRERIFMLGINPGRFGGGVTGVPFTDPVALREFAGIENGFEARRELSSEFIYRFFDRLGGLQVFADHFYLTAVCPFGFVCDGKNINYYDVPALQRELEPYIVDSLRKQIELGARRDVAIVIGTGKNATFLTRLNEVHHFFDRLHVVEHPRFIMQYRRKRLDEYLEKYASLCASFIVE